ncbi:MAG: flagellar basal-body MS-ring/collar protein FliF [Bacillota bacterium]
MKGPKDLFATVRKQLNDFFSKAGKGKLIRIGILAALFLIVVIVGLSLLNTTNYSVLYSDMETKDAGEVMDVLKNMGVDAKAEGSDTILVPSDKVDSLRMELSAQGYPKSGVNYDIFEKASGLGTTDMEKKTYLQFQLQANLRNTILMLDGVKDAAVSISMADDSAFVVSSDEKPATAAIMLETKSGKKLLQSQVQAIGELVSKSVPGGINLENIRIIDSQMHLYDLTGKDASQDAGDHLDLQNETRDSLQEQIINLLTPIFGSGNVLAEVNVQLDFDKKTTEEVKFSPPIEGETEGIAVSVKDLAETIQNYNGSSGGTTGTDSNGGASSYPSATPGSDAVYSKVSKETNLEVNQTKSLIESAQGQIKELSVAVLLNSTLDIEDYSENVKNLVAKAVGVDAANISVERLPFQKEGESEAADAFTQQQALLNSAQTGTLIRVIIIALAAVAIVILIIRALRSFLKPKEAKVQLEGGEAFVVGDAGVTTVRIDPDAQTPSQIYKKEIEEYIEKNAESVAQLLRNWLSDD